jgi:hypothetical protein
MSNICGTDDERQPEFRPFRAGEVGVPDPGLAPRRWGSASPAPGFTIQPLRGQDRQTAGKTTADPAAEQAQRASVHLDPAAEEAHRVKRPPFGPLKIFSAPDVPPFGPLKKLSGPNDSRSGR